MCVHILKSLLLCSQPVDLQICGAQAKQKEIELATWCNSYSHCNFG